MNPAEYYLNLLGGFPGSHDNQGGFSRPFLAAIMSHFQANSSTRTELLKLMDIPRAPGIMLSGEISIPAHIINRFPHLGFLTGLISYYREGRNISYVLNWDIVKNVQWTGYCPALYPLAQIYWLGFFLFGHNVIPQDVMDHIRATITPTGSAPEPYGATITSSPHIMAFLQREKVLPDNVVLKHTVYEQKKINSSLLLSLHFNGYWTIMDIARILLMEEGTNMCSELYSGRNCAYHPNGANVGSNMVYHHFYPSRYYNGTWKLEGVRSSGVPRTCLLLCCDPTTPDSAIDAMDGWPRSAMRGARFNEEIICASPRTLLCAGLMYEVNLFLTGQPLFDLEPLREYVTEHRDELVDDHQLSTLFLSERNLTTHRILPVFVDRVLQTPAEPV